MIDRPALEAAVSGAEPPELLALGVELTSRAAAALAQPTVPAEDPMLTMAEVADRLGIKEAHAREMGRRGELPVIIVGERRVRVRRSSLEKWIAAREAGGKVRG